jgi:uncharacterized SAM-binding protein YcdF (DUF218 family)
MTRLVAVLGYSDGRTGTALHPVCAARVARAEEEAAAAGDVVLFSGWARRGGASSEADLMAATWSGATRRHIVDRGARTTLGNAIAVGRAARRIDATAVLLVTSSWHARRASVLVRAALLGSGTRLRVASTHEAATPARGVRELAAWTVVPLLAVVAARTR